VFRTDETISTTAKRKTRRNDMKELLARES